jgi:phospholipid/cholesterol/gamma-HCH transport system substrate-binding protein
VNPTNHWKLGLFVLVAVILVLASAFYLGARRLVREKIVGVSFFDESVQGLDIGSPIKMRGVQIGSVRSIQFASDKRLVEVESYIYVDALVRMGLAGSGGVDQNDIPEDLVVRLASQGITGVRFLEVDFLPAISHPRLELPFREPDNYLPSTSSTLKGLEDTLNTFAIKMPQVMDTAVVLMNTINARVGVVDTESLSTNTIEVLELLEQRLEAFDSQGISTEARAALANLRVLLARWGVPGGPLDETLKNLTALAKTTEGAIADADLPGTTAAVREASRSLSGVGPAASLTLHDFQETLEASRRAMTALGQLLDYIERDPGALIRGRVQENSLPKGR